VVATAGDEWRELTAAAIIVLLVVIMDRHAAAIVLRIDMNGSGDDMGDDDLSAAPQAPRGPASGAGP